MEIKHRFSGMLDEIWQTMHSRWDCPAAIGFRDMYIQPLKEQVSEFEKYILQLDAAADQLESELSAVERQIRS